MRASLRHGLLATLVLLFLGPPGHALAATFAGDLQETRTTDVVIEECVVGASGQGWQNRPFATETGSFTVEFDATPSASPISGHVGLSLSPQTAYTGFATIVRFNTSGNIDARNGGAYAAASVIPYEAGMTYHFRLQVNVLTRTYSVFVRPAGGSEMTVGSNFRFRTEQNAVSSLNYWGIYVQPTPVGELNVCNFVVAGPPPPPPCTAAGAGSGFVNRSFANQTGSFDFEFDATPSANLSNSVIGLSNGPQSAHTGFAAAVRFNSSGGIDARNGGTYSAVASVPYQGGQTHHFKLEVNVPSHTYSVFVTPPGGMAQTVGSNFAFRSEQSSVGQLNNWAVWIASPAGAQTNVCQVTVVPTTPPPPPPPPDGTPVGINGQLHVCGTKLCNQFNRPIQLRGMSTHGLQWYGMRTGSDACINDASLDAVANDWRADIVRISLYVQEDGYETDPTGFTNEVHAIIEKVTQRGMYALVDWHMLDPGDPNFNLTRARTFFTAIAQRHNGKNNILYEIANEPNGVSWSRVKSYAEQIIPVIRGLDPDAVILVGTRAWSSLGVSDGASADEVFSNPVSATNIMYTFHFYAASHGSNYRNELSRAADRIPMFVTEFGTQQASGDGGNNFTSAQAYLDLMRTKKISWVNWNYSHDFRTGAVFTVGTCPEGPFAGTSRLKPAGVWVRERILNPPDEFPRE